LPTASTHIATGYILILKPEVKPEVAIIQVLLASYVVPKQDFMYV